jgi:hypothetical protein
MGGMGGMGGGMMGGGMGGFRSVPPASPPFASLEPGQTRKLATALVGLGGPATVAPAKGEPLRLGEIAEATDNARLAEALRRLAAERAPGPVAQLVLWRLGAGLDWNQIAKRARGWANAHELTLAQQFVARLGDAATPAESGALYLEIDSAGPATDALAGTLRAGLKDAVVLGLPVRGAIPEQPDGPAIACRLKLAGTATRPEAVALLRVSDPTGRAWVDSGKVSLALPRAEAGKEKETLAPALVADGLAAGLLDRLVRVKLLKDLSRDERGRNVMSFRLRIENASPLVLQGLTIVGQPAGDKPAVPATLLGLAVSPRKDLTVPASAQAVKELGLRGGVRAYAADLSGL